LMRKLEINGKIWRKMMNLNWGWKLTVWEDMEKWFGLIEIIEIFCLIFVWIERLKDRQETRGLESMTSSTSKNNVHSEASLVFSLASLVFYPTSSSTFTYWSFPHAPPLPRNFTSVIIQVNFSMHEKSFHIHTPRFNSNYKKSFIVSHSAWKLKDEKVF
jgi:hypothetical protein